MTSSFSKRKFVLTGLLFCLFLGYAPVGCAQNTDSLWVHGIKIKPVYFFKAGMRIDYFHQAGPYQWFASGVEFFHRSSSTETFPFVGGYNFNWITGYGVDAGFRVFVFDERKNGVWRPDGSYLAVNTVFQNFFAEFKDDFGLNFRQRTYRAGIDFLFGNEVLNENRASMGFYMGLGIRKSWHEAKEEVQPMSDVAWDYGFSGVVLLLGINLGYWF